MEMEIQFTALSDQRSFAEVLERLKVTDPPRYHLHMRCFVTWEFERTKVGQNGQVQQIQSRSV
jgi:hypothetical protein